MSTTPQTTPALTESDHKHKQLQCPRLPSPSENKKGSAKIPMPAEEVRQNKPAESVPTVTDALCGDVPKKSLRPEVLTSNVREVLKYVVELTPDKSHRVFHGVRPEEFKSIQHAVGEAGRISTKPRLAYDYDKHLLVVDMPSILHEASFDYIKDCLTLAIACLPYDRELVHPTICMNYPLKIRGGVVHPDMTITITALEDTTSVVVIPGVGECALSQNRAHVFDKVESEIEAHPEAVLAIIVLIREGISFTSPQIDSIASKELRNGDDDPQPLSLDHFIHKRSAPRSFNTPIRIAEHDWCHVQSVEYFVWVKGDNQDRIDVRDTNPLFMAHGTLGPTLDMDAVTVMLERGVRKIRDSLVSFSRRLDSEADCSDLEVAPVTFPIVWRVGAKILMTAADLTAHQRYDLWHEECIRGVKRSHDDESYACTESEHSSSDSQASATISSQDSLADNGASSREGNSRNKRVKGG
ncbi:hypothetical protein BD769DRAFT_1389646 [Suillus cothurnatus]|nr:hypothetical protein BD769DRAFT_1389646 [Suillus cothurnatus]